MKTLLTLFAASLLSLSLAHAEDSSSSLSSGGASADTGAVSEDSSKDIIGIKKFDEDKNLSDAELKSRAGSLSAFSVKANLSYFGPPVGDLSAPDQPNPDGTVSPTQEGPSGSIGTRYRLNSESSITANVGVTDQYLFTSKPSKWDANNPFVTYDRSFKLGSVQNVVSVGPTLITQDTYKAVGESWGLTASFYSAWNVPNTKFTLSNSAGLGHYFFDRSYIGKLTSATGKTLIAGDGKVRRTTITEAPIIKYNVTDKFNVNTSWGFSIFNQRADASNVDLDSRTVNEWVGIGYAVTRDIYINPYVQFYPTEFTWKTATMNVSTVFSLL